MYAFYPFCHKHLLKLMDANDKGNDVAGLDL